MPASPCRAGPGGCSGQRKGQLHPLSIPLALHGEAGGGGGSVPIPHGTHICYRHVLGVYLESDVNGRPVFSLAQLGEPCQSPWGQWFLGWGLRLCYGYQTSLLVPEPASVLYAVSECLAHHSRLSHPEHQYLRRHRFWCASHISPSGLFNKHRFQSPTAELIPEGQSLAQKMEPSPRA